MKNGVGLVKEANERVGVANLVVGVANIIPSFNK